MFQEYKPLKPRHAYGPQGHRGMSLLIFADTPVGYHDACRLEKLFIGSRRAREDWHRPSKLLFRPGGNRILYGYMAVKEDLDIFNRHSKGSFRILLPFGYGWNIRVILLNLRQLFFRSWSPLISHWSFCIKAMISFHLWCTHGGSVWI